MRERGEILQRAVDSVLDTMPPVWERIRSNLRSAATEKFGITLEQFHTLRHIRHGYRSVGDIAEKRQVSRSAISQAVEGLASKGLVTRSQESADRRCVALGLTPYASEVMDANYEENRAWMRSRMAGLSAGELECVRRAMDILRETFAPADSGRSGGMAR